MQEIGVVRRQELFTFRYFLLDLSSCLQCLFSLCLSVSPFSSPLSKLSVLSISSSFSHLQINCLVLFKEKKKDGACFGLQQAGISSVVSECSWRRVWAITENVLSSVFGGGCSSNHVRTAWNMFYFAGQNWALTVSLELIFKLVKYHSW